MKKLSNYLSSFQEIDLSALLGISVNDYANLHHGPLYEYKSKSGEVASFFMYIHPFNKQELLDKIKFYENFIVTFRPEDIYALRRKQVPFTDFKKANTITNYRTSETATNYGS